MNEPDYTDKRVQEAIAQSLARLYAGDEAALQAAIRRAIRYTFVPVLVSGLMRVDSIALSMKGRCFGLHRRRTAPHPGRLRSADGIALAAVAFLAALAFLAARGGWT